MVIPKTFQLAGVKWKVKNTKIMNELGLCDRDKATIHLKLDQEQSSRETTFCHELVHALKYTLGDGGPHEEKEVDALGYLLHQYMITVK
jgi:hypothetical protein